MLADLDGVRKLAQADASVRLLAHAWRKLAQALGAWRWCALKLLIRLTMILSS